MGARNTKQALQAERGGSKFKIPLVDFSNFSSTVSTCDTDSDVAKAQLHTAMVIDQVNRQHGFVCLRNSGIPHDAVQNSFKASQQLFNLDESAKASLKQIDPKTNTGYVGYGGEKLNRKRRTDLKEAFNVRQYSGENGDLDGTPPLFEDSTQALWKYLKKLGSQYATCCALALDLEDREYFSRTMNRMDLCTLRLLHYPPCDATDVKVNLDPSCAIRVGEHTEFGIFTFLFVNNFQDESSLGLQVKGIEGSDMNNLDHDNDDDDNWNDVVFDQESLKIMEGDETCAVIVNTGALMARWTNDIWRATAHRVIVSPKSFSSHRYSIAMFFDPDPEIVCSVHAKFVKVGEEPKYPPIKSLDYLLMKLKEAQGIKK